MGISTWQLLILAVIIVLLFGTKRLRTLGTDVGTAIRQFKQSMSGDSKDLEDNRADNKSAQKESKSEVS